jgi:hypothetical protein
MTGARRTVFVLLLVSYAYFYQAGGWNQNSRFDLVRAITNEHSLRIDPFQANTGDKAFFEGHYYSDKAPGVAFAATPIVWLARPLMWAGGGDPESYGGIAFLSYLGTVVTSGLFTALAAVILGELCLALGASEGAALFAALTYGLASPMWPLATLFLGHAISAAGLVFAYAAAVALRFRWPPRLPSIYIRDTYVVLAARDRDALLGLIVGLGGGWATVSEFPAAVPAAIITALALWHAWPLGRERAIRIVAALVFGALLCAAILMAYQWACFGSPFHIAYTSEQGFEAMQQGFFGIRTPTWARLRHILVEPYRGLLPLAPAFALAPVGLAILFVQNRRAHAATLAAIAIATYYILLNASYTYWEGGWSYGPRHLMPGLPFLAIGLAVLWTVTRTAVHSLLVVLSAVAAFLSLAAVSTMAQPPAQIQKPVAQLILPAFRDGDLALNTQRFTDGGANGGALRAHVNPRAAWNLGMKIGLTGHASLVPIALVWLLCAGGISAAARARRRRASLPT